MGKNPPKWLPGERVNETILVQRKSVEQLKVDRVLRKDKLLAQKERRKKKIDMKRKKKIDTKRFVSAQTILNQALKRDKEARLFAKSGEKFTSRLRRMKPEHVEKKYANASVCLIVRARGNIVPKDVERAFTRLGLDKIYKGRLVVQSPATDKLLKQLRKFSIVGFPTAEQLEQMIRTRGCFWNQETKSKAYISGNLQVEQRLGEFNILSIEELVDAVKDKIEKLPEVLRHLAPFDLHPPRKLFIERHRNARQKLEILNPESFAKYLQDELFGNVKATKAAKRSASNAKGNIPKKAVAHAEAKAEAKAEPKAPAKKAAKEEAPAKVVKAAPKKAAAPKAAAAKKAPSAKKAAAPATKKRDR